MKTIQIVVLLLAVVLIKVTSGANNYGIRPNFHFKDQDELPDNRYGSNELQTNDFGRLERRDFEKYTKFYRTEITTMEITADSGYAIDPAKIEISLCLRLKDSQISSEHPAEGNCVNHNDVIDKKRPVTLYAKPQDSSTGLHLFTFMVPDGCDCKTKI